MRIYLAEWRSRLPEYYLSAPRQINLRISRFLFAASISIPIKWHWRTWNDNCLCFFRSDKQLMVFQFRTLFIQAGVRIFERESNA